MVGVIPTAPVLCLVPSSNEVLFICHLSVFCALREQPRHIHTVAPPCIRLLQSCHITTVTLLSILPRFFYDDVDILVAISSLLIVQLFGLLSFMNIAQSQFLCLLEVIKIYKHNLLGLKSSKIVLLFEACEEKEGLTDARAVLG